MPTIAQATGDIAILTTVLEQASDEAIHYAFGFGRARLAEIVAGGDDALKSALVEKAWLALFYDPRLVSMPAALLKDTPRAIVAASLAKTVATSQFYSGAVKATAMHHRLVANTLVTRATYYQFEQATVAGVDRLLKEAFRELAAESGAIVDKILSGLSREADPKKQAALVEKIRKEVRAGRGTAAAHVAQMEAALKTAERQLREYLNERGLALDRLAWQRAVDTLYHYEHRSNWWSRLKHPLSSAELGAEIYNGRVQDLAVARIRTLVEARGLPFKVRRQISDIIAKEVIIKGENPKVAAAKIHARFQKELGERWGGSRVSAKRIARTEAAAIQSQGTLLAYEEMGVQWVNVQWTEGRYPCDICPPIADGGPYPINRVPDGGIPFHPNCRCAYSIAEPPNGEFTTNHPSVVFGAGGWARILAKYGFVAATAASAFGRENPTDEERAEVVREIGDTDARAVLEAPAIVRPGPDLVELTGFRRIEAGTYPVPMKGHFTEITARDPVRAIADLRKNSHEVGGLIRGKQIFYYRGESDAVSIDPIIKAVGGFTDGDIFFHTHPGSVAGGLSSSIPSEADIRFHLMISTYLGDGARHIIAGSDGLRELRVVVDDEERWAKNVRKRLFSIGMLFFEETMRGLDWYATYGIRRALKRLKSADYGGHLVISEPTTPGSAFIPLSDWNAPSSVSQIVVRTLQSLPTDRLLEIYESIAAKQDAPVHRDRDYFVGLLRHIDPARDWDEAAPTKTRALEILGDMGAGTTGTRWSHEELLKHLTGQPVFDRVYLDVSGIDYRKVLGLSAEVAPAIDRALLGDIMDLHIKPDFLDILFKRIAAVHGVPKKTHPSVMIAALETYDPKGAHFTLKHDELIEGMKRVGESMEWTADQKRAILKGEPVFGVTFLSDLSLVHWGKFFKGINEDPPEFTPFPPPPRDPIRRALGVSTRERHMYFQSHFGIRLIENISTSPWILEELRIVEHMLRTFPEAALHIESMARITSSSTHYDPVLRRLIVGRAKDKKDLNVQITNALAEAIVINQLRAGFMVVKGETIDYTGYVARMPVLRSWIIHDGWRYRDRNGLHDPVSTVGSEAILKAKGKWIDLQKREQGKEALNPWWTMIHSMLDFIWGDDTSENAEWMANVVFGGDTFTVEPIQVSADAVVNLPVRV